jgi:hypothetical protein
MQKLYDVVWHLSVYADNPEEAVIEATKTQQKEDSWANWFTVSEINQRTGEVTQGKEEDYHDMLVEAGVIKE